MPTDIIKWTCWNCAEENESESNEIIFMEMVTKVDPERLTKKRKPTFKVFNCVKCGEPNKVRI